MKKRIYLIIIILIIVIVLTLVLLLIYRNNKRENQVCIKDNCFNIELALTLEERERGLMSRKYLDSNNGMLFVFNEEGKYPFWMKNTLIPLDIIWINKEKEVIFINKNTQPCGIDVCPVINPDKKAQYVLELNGGIIDKIGLNIGDKVIFH